MTVITVAQWYDGILHYVQGEYWGMVGGSIGSADIVRCTEYQEVLEKYSIGDQETIQFRTGHKVYITNSDGRSCSIVVSTPVPIECPMGDHSLSLFAWKYEYGMAFTQGEYWALTGIVRSDYAYISRVSSSKAILETVKLSPCKLHKFSTGHEVYITNLVAGWTPSCRITVYPLGIASSTLYVNNATVGLDPNGDISQYDRSGVAARVILKGSGVGHLKISWGTDHSETIMNVSESDITYKYNLPPGTHNICAELFNVEA